MSQVEVRATGAAEGTGAAGAAGGAAGKSTALRAFLSAAVFDYLLVLGLSTALAFTVSYGFYGAEGLRGNFLLESLIAAPFLAALYCGSWSKRALVPAAIAACVVAAATVGICAALQPAGVPFMSGASLNDVPENYVIWALAVLVCALLVFLLSRRTVGMVALAALCVLACGAIQFLYRDWLSAHHGLEAALAVLFCVVALFIYQRYRLAALSGTSVLQPAFAKAFAFGALIAAACVALAAVLYFALVASLGLATPVIKPFQDYYKRPVAEYSAPVDKQQVENPNITSSNTNNNTQSTQQNAQGGSTSNSSGQSTQSKSEGSTTRLLSAYDEAQTEERYESTGYLLALQTLPVVLVLLALALLAAVLLRRRQRERRIAALDGESNAAKVDFLYAYLLRSFKKLKIECPATLTPLEFAFASLDTLAPFSRNAAHLDFVQLTLIYQRAVYGAKPITDVELNAVLSYYRAFFENARKLLGWRRWLFFAFWRV